MPPPDNMQYQSLLEVLQMSTRPVCEPWRYPATRPLTYRELRQIAEAWGWVFPRQSDLPAYFLPLDGENDVRSGGLSSH